MGLIELAKALHPGAAKVNDNTIGEIALAINTYQRPPITHNHVDEALDIISQWENSMVRRVDNWIAKKRTQLGEGWGHLAEAIGYDHLSKMYAATCDYLKDILR